jgi:hypothetical protein
LGTTGKRKLPEPPFRREGKPRPREEGSPEAPKRKRECSPALALGHRWKAKPVPPAALLDADGPALIAKEITGTLRARPNLARVGVVSATPSTWQYLDRSSIFGTKVAWNIVLGKSPGNTRSPYLPRELGGGLILAYTEDVRTKEQEMLTQFPVDILVYQGVRPTQNSVWCGSGSSVQIVLASRSPRSMKALQQASWLAETLELAHHQLGGLTDWKGSFTVLTRLKPGGNPVTFFDPPPSRGGKSASGPRRGDNKGVGCGIPSRYGSRARVTRKPDQLRDNTPRRPEARRGGSQRVLSHKVL